MYRIESIENLGAEHGHRIVIADDSAVVESVTVGPGLLAQAVAELYITYDFASHEGDVCDDLQGPWFLDAFPELDVYLSPKDLLVVGTKNGDTGHIETGDGESVVDALSSLVRAHGFKSKLPDGGAPSLSQWLKDFNYGMTRISDEILQQEMDIMFETDKGAW